MASLTGTKIKDTYDALLKVSDNGALDGTLQTITDGLGNNSSLSLSTAGASVAGTLSVSGGITGTLSTAAQTNITSVGTLSSLAVSGTSVLTGATSIGTGSQPSDTQLTVLGNYQSGFYRNLTSGGRGYFLNIGANSPSGLINAVSLLGAVESSNTDGYLAIQTLSSGTLSEKMRIDSSGNVGINCTASNFSDVGFSGPFLDVAGVFQVKGTSANGVAIIQLGGDTYRKATIETSIGTSDPYLAFGTSSSGSSSSTTERMRINSSGNVGIGTSPSGAKLHTYSTGAQDNLLKIQNGQAGYASGIQLQASTDGGAVYNYITSGTTGSAPMWQIGGGATNNTMVLYTGGSERMRIDSAGNVGIGTTSPASYISRFIEVSNATSAGIKLTSTSGLSSGVSMGYIASDKSFRITNYESTGVIRLETNDTERMRITSGGSLLIKKTSASDTLVNGFAFNEDGTSTMTCNFGVTAAMMVLNQRDGGGTTKISFRTGDAERGSISWTSSATSYNTSSDYRLKEDWVAMEGALDRVDALKPVNFAWKADGSRVDGFLAHELAEVVPEAVTGEKDATEIRSVEVSPAVYEDVIHPAEEAILDEEGNVIQEAKGEWVEKVLVSEAVFEDQEFPVYQGIDQSKIVPLLVAAIQELRAEIESLKSQING